MLTNAIRITKPKINRLPLDKFQARIRKLARDAGAPAPAIIAYAYTIPTLNIDATQRIDSRSEIAGTGVGTIKKAALTGTLEQEIMIQNHFSVCEEKYVLEHEHRHARDNQSNVKLLHKVLQKHASFPASYFEEVSAERSVKNQASLAKLAEDQFFAKARRNTTHRDNSRHGDLAKTMKLIKQNCNSHETLGYQFLKRGARGYAVVKLQLSLNVYLLAKFQFADMLLPDGIFGRKTEDAVRIFQNAACKPADGIVGPKTSNALRLN